MPYEIVVKNWWKENKAWPDGLEPDGWGEPETIQRDVATEAEARAICQAYNDTHDPGRLLRRAEYRDDGTTKEYNGYPNYHTWAASLWADNEYAAYKQRQTWLARLDHKVDAEDVRDFLTTSGIRAACTDLDPEEWKYVDFEHIAGNWEDERQEIID